MGYSKVVLHGTQTCDYLYIQNNNLDNSGDFEHINTPPQQWNNNTLLFAQFENENNPLLAGNSDVIDNIKGYEVRRRKDGATNTDYIATIKQSDKKYILDYLARNDTSYMYYIYPSTDVGENVDRSIFLHPITTNEVKPRWNYWSLMVVDETEDKNVFYLNKMFKFELNLTTGDMSNNAVVNIIPNFTPYPTVQYGASNYWSGELTALSGIISCTDDEYIQPPDIIEEFKYLTSDEKRKFLKDMDGNVYEVKISSPVVVSTDDKTIDRIKTIKISWVEVGSTDGLSVIDNPNLSSTSWLLTQTGTASPYLDYVWTEEDIWNNSHRWTSNANPVDINSVGIPLI